LQTKTKQRVKDFGEVFTNKREIINMLSLIDNSSKNFSKLKDTIILEPTCGNGNFIIEIAKRKLDFYSSEEDQKEALSTIYGTDIQEDNILETRSRLRELVDFDIEDILHSNFFVSNFLEYDFSKKLNKIDIVIGNPPYQTDDNGHGASSSPIYNLFIDKIRNELKPTYFSFIIPSRWMTGGKGLAKFRHTMLNDTKFEVLVDFKNDKDCFPTVSIEGGVCYFLWNINYEGLCSYIEMDDDQIISKKNRNLKEYDIFIRDNQSISILKKVISKTEDFLYHSIKRPGYGFNTNFYDYKDLEDKKFNIRLYGNKLNMKKTNGIGYVSKEQISGNLNTINKYKVLIPKARGGIAKDKQIVTKPTLTNKLSVCSQTYVVIGAFDQEEEAKKLDTYIHTKFFRYLVSLRKLTQDLSINTYKFIPSLNSFDFEISDSNLYSYFNLNEKEIDIIENRIKIIK